ncbi:MAG: NAD-dependent epimerase/dehydratase family protein [Candidatus Kapaibacterium sp.]
MNILVTGGAGFIGSNICDVYLAQGHDVIVLDNLSNSSGEFINKGCKFYKNDIYLDNIEYIFKENKIDVINHQAAQIDLRDSIVDPVKDLRINIEGSLNLLQLAEKYKVKKFIFASSGGAAYGEQVQFPASEDHIIQPLSPYGISKTTIEKYLFFYKNYYNINYIILRYANIFGERQGNSGEGGVVSVFMKNIITDKISYINGDGTNTRDYVYVKDVADANFKALDCNVSDFFNISTGTETSANLLVELIKKVTGTDSKFVHRETIKGEQKRSCLDNNKANIILGWKPVFKLEDGLKNTYQWFKSFNAR